ncbi:MAG: small ribosomal subunit Rsm22 family protein, partial [Spirochaetaceae bacterium]|nr:small ribosomal subunit Rsm22 family protein [Spirochaetaceae bacterium]
MLFPHLPPETGAGLADFLRLVDTVFPLPRKFRAGLAGDVAALSGLLTARRGERPASYLSRPAFRSAYLRYFLPWNLYRLCRLLPSLPLSLGAGDRITDLGSGPLTTVLGLWLARPDMRETPLEFRCVDRSGSILDAGKALFGALAGAGSPWRIQTIRAALDAPLAGPKAALVSALNVFNEGEVSGRERASFGAFARAGAGLLQARSARGGALLVVEPGTPDSGRFMALTRDGLLKQGYRPGLPCPHSGPCPLRETKWCHFAFDTQDAPEALKRLAHAAGIPKVRATLSFLFAVDATAEKAEAEKAEREEKAEGRVRVISDLFPVSPGTGGKAGGYGRYGCSVHGLALLTGSRAEMENSPSGALVEARFLFHRSRDPKTGAVLAR